MWLDKHEDDDVLVRHFEAVSEQRGFSLRDDDREELRKIYSDYNQYRVNAEEVATRVKNRFGYRVPDSELYKIKDMLRGGVTRGSLSKVMSNKQANITPQSRVNSMRGRRSLMH